MFGVSGFGSGLVAIPFLTHIWPLQLVVPIMVLLDLAAALPLGIRERRHADWGEIAWLTPPTLLGLAAGVALLTGLPPVASMASLGAVVTAYGLWSWRGGGPRRPIGRAWAVPAGLASGVASGLFALGGAPVVVYLMGRALEKSAMRATLAMTLLVSVAVRIVMLGFVALMGWREIVLAAALAPFALAGLAAGGRAHLAMSREQFNRAVAGLVVLAGATLLARAALP